MEKWLKWNKQTEEMKNKAGYDKSPQDQFQKGSKSENDKKTEEKKKFWRLSDLLYGNFGNKDTNSDEK